MLRYSLRLLLLASATLLPVGGCSPSPTSTSKDGLELVRLQLNWLPDAQFGGYYAALLSGEYERAGLSVDIRIGGPDASVLPKLAMNRVEFGLGNADQLLLAQQEGADVVAVFAVMQDNPRCIMVHESSSIDSFEKLQNVTLAMGEGNAFAKFLQSKLTLDGVRIVSYSGNIAKFVLDNKFTQQGYVFSEPIVAAQRGASPRSLMVSELGFNPYAGIVMTNRRLIEERPEVVRSFVEATRRGWEIYLEAPEQANNEIHRLNEEVDSESLNAAVAILRELCFAGTSNARNESEDPENSTTIVPFGQMTDERWQELQTQLIELELLKPSTPLNPHDVFTNEFNIDSSKLSP